jgi:1-deoxy-D-xylulose-5-phosphate reductoisomerase
MKRVIILGSTGSIGRKSLDVISKFKDDFQILGLSAKSNFELLLRQARDFNVRKVSLWDEEVKDQVASYDTKGIEIYYGKDGIIKLLEQEADLVIFALSGIEAIYPLLFAFERGLNIAIANKEAIVAGGELIKGYLWNEKGPKVLPLDSEHNAIFQLIQNIAKEEINKVILTCSGGPFLNTPLEDLEEVTPEMALSHPKWDMGQKITIDSATLMNKGFEVIEAHYLFQLHPTKIKVLIHPEAIIHGMVELNDGTVLAQLAETDMRMAISYALGYPERLDIGLRLNLASIGKLSFQEPEGKRFLALEIAYDCLEKGLSYPAFLAKVDEIFVNEFLKGKIKFPQILELISKALSLHEGKQLRKVEDLENVIEEAEEVSKTILGKEGIYK